MGVRLTQGNVEALAVQALCLVQFTSLPADNGPDIQGMAVGDLVAKGQCDRFGRLYAVESSATVQGGYSPLVEIMETGPEAEFFIKADETGKATFFRVQETKLQGTCQARRPIC